MNTRQQYYAYIKAHKLEEGFKRVYGKAYINCSNEILKLVIDAHKEKETSKSKESSTECTYLHKVNKLIQVLSRKRILLQSELEEINN
jgi:predicted component of viral defense system (DUF524 family)